jgi:Uncharacterized protein conserved in bacteria
MMESKTIIDFWFNEIDPALWFKKDDAFDALIKTRFLTYYEAAFRGELFVWRKDIEGRLAEIIVLDQFPRNMFRDRAAAFAGDGMALILTQEAIATGDAHKLPTKMRAFLYMPMMHSESLRIHEEAVRYFSEPELENNLSFELKHKAIIERFGRYPHRNAALDRRSTEEEKLFLQQPGSSF